MSILQGPADADHYRVKVGRYNERWYQDGDNGPYPSISTVKKASGSDWTFVALKRVAAADDLPSIAGLDEASQRYERLKQCNRNGLDQAAGRGTIIHLWLEDGLHGRPFRNLTDLDLQALKLPRAALTEAELYRPALDAFFNQYQPELILTETVAIHTTLNGVGYGGTVDAGIRIGGEAYGVDWKTRSIDSDHGAYPEEAAQIAAGWRAEYMITANGAGVDRCAPPPVDTGLIVSIKPDGIRIYPVDMDKAFQHWTAMHAWWVARRDERKSIGRAWQPADQPATVDLRTNLRDRIATIITQGRDGDLRNLWPQGVPTLASDHPHTDQQLAAIQAAVAEVERRHELPFNPPTTPLKQPTPAPQTAAPVPPDDGDPLDENTIKALRRHLDALPPTAQAAVAQIAQEAHAAGHSISVQQKPCVRRFELARALITWAENGADLDRLAAAVADISTVEQAASDTTGAALSTFSIEQARQLAEIPWHKPAA